ncbi:MAG: carbohydrate ABC transporter permease [Ruminiclostridium sp.]
MKKLKFMACIKYIFVWLAVCISLYPLIYIITIALKSNDEFISNPNGLPKGIYWKNFVDAWILGKIGTYAWNTIYMTAATIMIVVIISALTGFAIEKLCGKKDGKIFYNFFIIGIIMPLQVIMLPLFKILKLLNMINNPIGIIFIYVTLGLPFAIFVFTGFFKSIPDELIESARIDGCTYLKTFWRIVFPLCKVVTATVAIFVGIDVWKDFTVPLVFVTNPALKTLSVGLLYFNNEYNTNWTALSAAMLLQTLPIIGLYIAMQERFVEGITAGAVKG